MAPMWPTGGFGLQAAHSERGWRSRSGPSGITELAKQLCLCHSAPRLHAFLMGINPSNPLIEIFHLDSSLRGQVQEANIKPGLPGKSPQGPAVLAF